MNRILNVLALLCAFLSPAWAAYPDKPIRLVVPFPAGSATDNVARTVSEAAARRLGQPIVIENKPGADGQIAASDVAGRAPDGYTLFVGTSSPLSIAPAIRRKLPYDPAKDFSYITTMAVYTYMLYVSPSLPVRSYPQFIEYVRQQPGKLNYATGNMSNIAYGAQMKAVNNIVMEAIAYKGEPDGMIALVSGDVHAMWATTSVGVEMVRAGRVRALVTSASARSALLPDVPTIAETGMPPFSVEGWALLAAPAGLPDDVVRKLNAAFTAAIRSPEVVERLSRNGFVAKADTPQETARFVKAQAEEYLRALRGAGVLPE